MSAPAAAALALAGCEADAPLAPDTADAARSASHARATSHPGGATVVYRAEMRVDDPPVGPFALVHAMLEFQPGAWFPVHTHGGPALARRSARRARGPVTPAPPPWSWPIGHRTSYRG